VVFRQKNPVLAQSYFKLAYSALACNKKGSSGSASFHSAENPGMRCGFVGYGMARQKASQRGEKRRRSKRSEGLIFISSATLCREEPAVREFDIGVAPRTDGAPSTPGQ
jgi:hypothetical protein